MKRRILICFAVMLTVFYSCKNEGTKTKEAHKTAVAVKTDANLKAEIDMLSDTLQTRWNEMIRSDEEKIADIQRLLQEISYTPAFDEKQVKTLAEASKRLSAKRYDRRSMADSDKIDAYDMAQDSVLKPLYALTLATPAIDNYPLAAKLVTDIQERDNDVVIYRSRYDMVAKELNSYIRNYGEQLKRLGAPYDTLRELPLFEIKE